jgi:hypothetical protein
VQRYRTTDFGFVVPLPAGVGTVASDKGKA